MIVEILQKQRFDETVFKHYGNLDYFEKVLEINKHLVHKLVLEAGDKVELPEFEEIEKTTQIKALWD
jgi:phage tail protein X